MSGSATDEHVVASPEVDSLPLNEVDRELKRLLSESQGTSPQASHRARISNLLVFCDSEEAAAQVAQEIPAVVTFHPARVLLMIGTPGPESDVRASVNVWCQLKGNARRVCSEQITLRASGGSVANLPFSVRQLLVGELPVNLWWASSSPPPSAGVLLYDLAHRAQQVIFDSRGWVDPSRAVVATANWLVKFEHSDGRARWRIVSDLNWRRIKYWRRLIAQALDPALAPGAIESISDVAVEHGPHAVIQAWELVSWLASCLSWRVHKGTLQPGLEIIWHCKSRTQAMRIRLQRQPEGPSDIRSVRIACSIAGQPTTLVFEAADERHLAVRLLGENVAPRTLAIQSQPIAELVARQLSDRDREDAFRQSLSMAQIFAQSLLG